jgi:ATP-dependent DNA helicase RecQ
VKQGGSGIVYCSTRKAADGIHAALLKKGYPSVLYHAGMEEAARRRAQEQFMATPNAVAVATNAFGMGIDKADIRFVIHANIPRAVEAYYQEIGRGGRDGGSAQALLLFNHADVFTQERLIQSNHPSEAVFSDVWSVLQQVETFDRGTAQLATQIGASEFEVSAVFRLLERDGHVERSMRGEGAYGITLLAKSEDAHPHSPDAQALLTALRHVAPIGIRASVELGALARRTGLSWEALRHAFGLLERARVVSVRRPFAGKAIRALKRVPFRNLGLDMTRIREQERRSLLLLKRMTDYAYQKSCRRRFLLRYFGESAADDNCGQCDTCAGSTRPAATATKPRIRTRSQSASPGPFAAIGTSRRRRSETR